MVNKINTTLAVCKKSPLISALSALNLKRKKLWLSFTTAVMMSVITAFTASADSGMTNEGEAQFNAVIEFFASWIGRIGMVVGFIGAIQFALAIKNDDADAKTRGLMTLAAGFVVFGITKALNLFGINTGII